MLGGLFSAVHGLTLDQDSQMETLFEDRLSFTAVAIFESVEVFDDDGKRARCSHAFLMDNLP